MTENSKIPRLKFRIPRINSRILEFLKIASVALLPRNDEENSRIPKLEFLEIASVALLPRND